MDASISSVLPLVYIPPITRRLVLGMSLALRCRTQAAAAALTDFTPKWLVIISMNLGETLQRLGMTTTVPSARSASAWLGAPQCSEAQVRAGLGLHAGTRASCSCPPPSFQSIARSCSARHLESQGPIPTRLNRRFPEITETAELRFRGLGNRPSFVATCRTPSSQGILSCGPTADSPVGLQERQECAKLDSRRVTGNTEAVRLVVSER